MKRPAASISEASKEEAQEQKEVPKSELSLRILYIAGGELLQLPCPPTWTTTDVKAAVTRELWRVQAQGDLQKLVHVGGGVIADGQKLAEAGLQNGSEIYAVLHEAQEELCEDTEEDCDWEEDELFVCPSDSDSSDDEYGFDPRPARPGEDACIRGCGKRGCDFYGGECSDCYGEH
jgi:hypothetical protein